MRIARILGFVGVLTLGVVAACHAYYPCGPTCTEKAATPAPVNDLLAKLEALKAKKDAIEKEEKPLLAELAKQMRERQARMEKLGIMPAQSPNTTFIPVYAPKAAPGAPSYAPSAPCSPPTAPTTYSAPSAPGAPQALTAPVSYYEPVTSYKMTRVYDSKTQSYVEVPQAVTTYVYREASPSYEVCPPPAPAVSPAR